MDNRGEGDNYEDMLKEMEQEDMAAKADYGIRITEEHQKARIVVTCPLTQQPLVDPVVNPVDGVSYERSAIVNDEDKDLYYPNRALKEYIEATSSSEHVKSVLDVFLCPITKDLMRDPVIDNEGITYERSALVGWIQEHGVSPITRKPLMIDQLYSNATLFWVLLQEIQLHNLGDSHWDDDDTVREWKKALSSPSGDDQTSYEDFIRRILQEPRQLQQRQPVLYHYIFNAGNRPLVTTANYTDVSLSTNRQLNDLVHQQGQAHARNLHDMIERQRREKLRQKEKIEFVCLSILSIVVVVVLVVCLLKEAWVPLFFILFVLVIVLVIGFHYCCAFLCPTYSRNSLAGALNGV